MGLGEKELDERGLGQTSEVNKERREETEPGKEGVKMML